jgi:hypothetical protein
MKKQAEEILISTSEALEIVQTKGVVPISLPTIINWAQAYGIGKKVGGRWWVDKEKLTEMLVKGNPPDGT